MPEGRKAKLNEKQLALTIEAIPLAPDRRSKEQQNMLERERNRVRGAVREVATDEERKTISELEQRLKSLEKDKPQPMMAWVYADSAKASHRTSESEGTSTRGERSFRSGFRSCSVLKGYRNPGPPAIHLVGGGPSRTGSPGRRHLWPRASWPTGYGNIILGKA